MILRLCFLIIQLVLHRFAAVRLQNAYNSCGFRWYDFVFLLFHWFHKGVPLACPRRQSHVLNNFHTQSCLLAFFEFCLFQLLIQSSLAKFPPGGEKIYPSLNSKILVWVDGNFVTNFQSPSNLQWKSPNEQRNSFQTFENN